jgi:hypothetical protein
VNNIRLNNLQATERQHRGWQTPRQQRNGLNACAFIASRDAGVPLAYSIFALALKFKK